MLALAWVAYTCNSFHHHTFLFPISWMRKQVHKGNWNSNPGSPSPEAQSQPPPYTSIPHSPLLPPPPIKSPQISYGLSLFSPPDSHKPIQVARRENSENCGMWLGLPLTGMTQLLVFLTFFFFNSNLGLWPVQVKSDSVEPETQKQIK